MWILKQAFPSRLRDNVDNVLNGLNMNDRMAMGPSAILDGERLNIPYRIYFTSRTHRPMRYSVENVISLCIYTRHHDGFVRQASLSALLSERDIDSFAIPFTLKLAEEYVLDIVKLVLSHIRNMPTDKLRHFLRENPRWIGKMHARCVSYWNCYYRGGQFWNYNEYPGAKIVAYLQDIQSDSCISPK